MKSLHIFRHLGTMAPTLGMIVTLANAAAAQGTNRTLTVPVSVIAGKSEPASGLKQDDFQLLEDNKEQKISLFLPTDSPIGFGIIVGASALAIHPDETGRRVLDALKAFQKNSNTANEYFFEPFGFDGIEGAIRNGLGEAARSHNRRKVLLVILDANDNPGRPLTQSSLDAFQKQDIPVYFVAIGKYPYDWSDIARNTGGSVIYTTAEFNLTAELVKLAAQLRSEYLLGFISSNTAQDGKWRSLKVNVTGPDEKAKLAVRYRSRYFVPKPAKTISRYNDAR
jgi:Ca-activated chloride channel homolog